MGADWFTPSALFGFLFSIEHLQVLCKALEDGTLKTTHLSVTVDAYPNKTYGMTAETTTGAGAGAATSAKTPLCHLTMVETQTHSRTEGEDAESRLERCTGFLGIEIDPTKHFPRDLVKMEESLLAFYEENKEILAPLFYKKQPEFLAGECGGFDLPEGDEDEEDAKFLAGACRYLSWREKEGKEGDEEDDETDDE
jgi:hypothetical protein